MSNIRNILWAAITAAGLGAGCKSEQEKLQEIIEKALPKDSTHMDEYVKYLTKKFYNNPELMQKTINYTKFLNETVAQATDSAIKLMKLPQTNVQSADTSAVIPSSDTLGKR